MSPKSMIGLTEHLKSLSKKVAEKLQGSDRRQFMAEVVKGLGIGGQAVAERELGWNRRTIRKGRKELESGEEIIDRFSDRGRKRIETKLPNLIEDIKAIVDPSSQTDPSFKSTKLYTRITAAEVRRQLIEQKNYKDEELPSAETIRRRLNELGYTLKRVVKTKPIKEIPETAAIFEQVGAINEQADNDPNVLRISMDAKVAIKVGEFDRGGKTRVTTVALDHDFPPPITLTPYGIFLPATSSQLNLQLAYYPPYHSKYNPVERCFGWLEQHWNGSLLDTVDTVLNFAQTLTFKGQNPIVTLVNQVYATGVKLTTAAMTELEQHLHRHPSLPKWFVEIFPQPD